MYRQANMYTNDNPMSPRSNNIPPVLINETNFEQWRDRFIDFIERQENGENMMRSFTEGPMRKMQKKIPATATEDEYIVEKDYSTDELNRLKADKEVSSNLILALPKHIIKKIECFKQNMSEVWI